MIRGRTEYLRLCEELQLQGFDGMVASLSAEDIIDGWIRAGWVVLSPNRVEIRVTEAGEEQLDKWKEEDRLWNERGTETMPLKKRLVAGEPAKNLRKIQSVIGNSTVTGIHDPYTTAGSLGTLLKLADLGTKLSPALRILGTPKPLSKSTDRMAMIGLLKDINTERKATWEVRTYTEASAPHRRFLVLDDGSVVTCGMSLNHIDKDEVLDREPAGSENANHDHQFFDDKWKIGTVVK
jgi:hypothetical protein